MALTAQFATLHFFHLFVYFRVLVANTFYDLMPDSRNSLQNYKKI